MIWITTFVRELSQILKTQVKKKAVLLRLFV